MSETQATPRFRIYYDDGSTYSGDPFLAPQVGVQVIVLESQTDRGFILIYSKSLSGYYCLRNGAWFVTDDAGFWDYLLIHQGPKKIIFGRTMARTDEFWKMIKRASSEGLG